jgi:hypothetical protein
MRILIAAIIFLFSSAAAAAGQVPLTDGPSVNGLRLRATYRAVVAKFGKPQRVVTNPVDECVGDRTRFANYPGLKFELVEDNGTFTVYSFEVTSPRYIVSGVAAGASQAAVERRFGRRNRTVDREGRDTIWYYSMPNDNPGTTNFHFRNGKLFKVVTTFAMC